MVSYEEIFSHINEKEVVECLQDLVRAPSENPPGDYSEITPIIVDKLKDIGFEVDLIGKPGKKNIIGTLKGTVGKPVIMFLTHIDTVPVGDLSSWSVDPFGGEEREERVYGRGSCDPQCVNAGLLMAANALKKADVELTGDLIYAGTIDEETGWEDGLGYLIKSGFMENVDMVVACQAYGWDIPIASRGTVEVELTTTGKSMHPAGPDYSSLKPNNAITNMVEVISAISNIDNWMTYKPHEMIRPETGGGWTYKPTLETTVIRGGFKSNIVPDKCTAEIDMRILPGQTGKGVISELRQLLERLEQWNPDLKVELKTMIFTDPALVRSETLIEVAKKSVEIVLNKEPKLRGVASALVDNWLKETNIPLIKFGPKAECAHQPDEWMSIDEVVTAAKIYAVMSINLLT